MAHLRAPQQPPPPATAPAPAAAPATGEAVHITLTVDSKASYPPTAVIWVIARAAGVTSGPPSAVKRVALGAFPITVDLSAADSMMGQPLPSKMRIEARIDSDGDPMTHDPKDPKAVADGVGVGGRVSLTLR